VDQLFRSLGQTTERAVGIILSGTGSDGSLGLKEIIVHGASLARSGTETAHLMA